jgi:hypothetical protein
MEQQLEALKKAQKKNLRKKGETLAKSPLYAPKEITVVQERGTVKSLTYQELRDKGVLLTPPFDHSTFISNFNRSQFYLKCCFTGHKEYDMVLLKNLSFLFLSTGIN